MRKVLALIIAGVALFAEDKPTNAALQAEVESLKTQLAQLKLEYAYSMQVCTAPDLMSARLATQAAAQKAEAAKPKPAEPIKSLKVEKVP